MSSEPNKPKYKSKAQKQREVEERVNASMPDVDVGQFAGITSSYLDVEVESKRALAVAQRVMYGAQIRDACLIEGAKKHAYTKALQRFRKADSGDTEGVTDTRHIAKEGTWTYALGYTLDRALALCRVRWQMLAEAGGKGSSTALWMLERRGGRGFLPPVRREQVTSTTTTTTTTTTLEAKLEATRVQLGFDDDHLAQMGEWLARAQTQAQRGEALPEPPLLEPAHSAPASVTVIDIEGGE
jgi:hypothetical protein